MTIESTHEITIRYDKMCCSGNTAANGLLRLEPCSYTNRVILRAASIVRRLKKVNGRRQTGNGVYTNDKLSSDCEPFVTGTTIPVDFTGPLEKKQTFELAFTSLKC